MVESSLNGYGLVHGLQDEGSKGCLAPTLERTLSTGARMQTDRRHA